ncbi:MAG: acetylxylan esterase [Planctomycetes bacterium]|nr:acetylxylan esterase [Planctomycetota bacterium]
MSRILIAVSLFATATLGFAAEDLTVLKPGPKDTPPRKLLHTQLLAECQKHFDARNAEVEKLKTPADIAARQTALKAKFIQAIGGFPEKTPLNAKVVGTLKRDGYRIEKVIYESQPEHHVTANLYIPEGKGPFPGVIMPIGHSSNGKAAEYMQRGALLLVKNGFVALVYDPIGQGERSQLLDKLGNPAIKGTTSEHTMVGVGAILVGRGTASYRIWDGIRSIDYLVSRPEVDAKKIGCTGCSGGGTLTSYLMALDDRIEAAAPSCYITSLERLFATLGPQDAEQNITGQVALGIDHADYIFMRAPKPTLLLASTRDFFDIQGTWDSFREAKRVYTKLGLPERVELIEADATHGYPKSHREAMARFFSRFLKGEDKVIVEADCPIEKDADLLCTRSGQVLEDLKGRSVFDLNATLADEFAKKRAAEKLKPDAFRKEVERLIGLGELGDVPPAGVTFTANDDIVRPGYLMLKTKMLVPGSNVPVVVLGFIGNDRPDPVTFYLHEAGKDADAAPGGAIEKLAKSGKWVMALDVRGRGETAPAVAKDGKTSTFGVEFKESFLSLHLGKPLLGQQTHDLMWAMGPRRPKAAFVELVAVGSSALVALHAAVLHDGVKSVTIDGGLVSWDSVLRTPISHNQLANVVPGALKLYDLPDLAAAIAPRPLTIRNPVDAAGKPLTKEAAEEAYKGVRAAYKDAKAADKFILEVAK